MPNVIRGQFASITVRDDWVAAPAVPQMPIPTVSPGGLFVQLIPQISVQHQVHYATLMVREVAHPMERAWMDTQLMGMTNPQMSAQVLSSLGVRPLSLAGPIQQIDVHGRPCRYRIVDGAAMMTNMPVRCYLGKIDWTMQSVAVVAIAVLQAWPLLLPQMLEMITSIGDAGPMLAPAPPGPAQPIFVHQATDGTVAYKVQQEDGSLRLFDSLKIPEGAQVHIHVGARNTDVRYEGDITVQRGATLGGDVMTQDRSVHISGGQVGDIFTGDNVTVNKNQQAAFDPAAFTGLVEELLGALRASGANDAPAKLAANHLETAKLQAAAGEDRNAVAKTLDTAVSYLKKSEQAASSALGIGQILLKIGKVVGAAIAWL